MYTIYWPSVIPGSGVIQFFTDSTSLVARHTRLVPQYTRLVPLNLTNKNQSPGNYQIRVPSRQYAHRCVQNFGANNFGFRPKMDISGFQFFCMCCPTKINLELYRRRPQTYYPIACGLPATVPGCVARADFAAFEFLGDLGGGSTSSSLVAAAASQKSLESMKGIKA